jgi:hypothetical protein
MLSAYVFCATGVYLSSLLSRTLTATVLSYAITMLFVFGIPILFLTALIIFNVSIEQIIDELTPLTEYLLLIIIWVLISFSPVGVISLSEFLLIDQENIFIATIDLTSGPEVHLPAPWILFFFVYGLIGTVLLRSSILRVKRKEQ